MSTKAPTADRFGFGPLIATQPQLHPVNSHPSKSRQETYLTAVVTCSRWAEGWEVKQSKGQLPTTHHHYNNSSVISWKMERRFMGGRGSNLRQTQNITESDRNPSVQVRSCDFSVHACTWRWYHRSFNRTNGQTTDFPVIFYILNMFLVTE